MRVLSGKYKNRKLKSLKGEAVRPTSSFVKKSLFDILKLFDDKKVLDLFSGTGSLGIESLSRGAQEVVFVEKNRMAFKTLSENLRSICPDDNFTILQQDVYSFLNQNNKDMYDIVFADPPYGLIQFEELKDKVCKMLKYGGIFCMEQSCDSRVETEGIRVKKYGNTQILIWEKQKK